MFRARQISIIRKNNVQDAVLLMCSYELLIFFILNMCLFVLYKSIIMNLNP